MKIVITAHTYYPNKDGVQVVTEYLAEGLVQKGHNVTVVTPVIPGAPLDEEHNGVIIHRVNVSTVHCKYKGDIIGYQKYIIDLANNSDCLINMCMQTATTDVLLPLLRKMPCKKILYMHGMFEFTFNNSDWSNGIQLMHKVWCSLNWRSLYSKLGRYISEYDKIIQLHSMDYANQYFIKRYRVKTNIIENAADDAFFKQNNNSSLKEKYGKYALFVGNYDPNKNQIDLVRAFVKANIPDLSLVMIGSTKNAYYEKVIEVINNSGDIGKLIYALTSVPRTEVSDYVEESLFYMMSSRVEKFPVSIVEAMAEGKAFISYDAGITRYLPGGVIVKNPDEMAEWMKTMYENPDVMYSYGNAGKMYAQKHLSRSVAVNKLENIIENL